MTLGGVGAETGPPSGRGLGATWGAVLGPPALTGVLVAAGVRLCSFVARLDVGVAVGVTSCAAAVQPPASTRTTIKVCEFIAPPEIPDQVTAQVVPAARARLRRFLDRRAQGNRFVGVQVGVVVVAEGALR